MLALLSQAWHLALIDEISSTAAKTRRKEIRDTDFGECGIVASGVWYLAYDVETAHQSIKGMSELWMGPSDGMCDIHAS